MTKHPDTTRGTDQAPVSEQDARIQVGGSLHDAFLVHVERLLADKNLSEDDRRKILDNLTCPCCGGGVASMVVPLDD